MQRNAIQYNTTMAELMQMLEFGMMDGKSIIVDLLVCWLGGERGLGGGSVGSLLSFWSRAAL